MCWKQHTRAPNMTIKRGYRSKCRQNKLLQTYHESSQNLAYESHENVRGIGHPKRNHNQLI